MRGYKSYISTSALVVSLLILGGWFILRDNENENDVAQERIKLAEELPETSILAESAAPTGVGASLAPLEGESVKTAPTTPVSQRIIPQDVLLNVPFTSQAPFGNWDNVVFQQGCEEASMLMAMLWVEGKKFISASGAKKAILAISNFEQKNYGEFRDTSVSDTAKIMRDYFGYENIEVKNGITAEDIKSELASGHIVIVPVNGQRLGNPFYTPPGPLQHMLVVRGYDEARREFITNDPGTRRGEAFRYKEDVLEAALRDYVTGYKEPIREVRKAMIVIGR